MSISKRFKSLNEKVDTEKRYTLEEGIDKLKECASAKFDESVEISINLGVDPKYSDQQVRGTVSLPHGIGKNVRVLVINRGDKDAEAKEAGADFVGFEDYVSKIQEGWVDFDVMVATPDVMSTVGKLGKVLGKRGLMPNPKAGTVTNDVGKAVKEIKAGKIEIRVDKFGILHSSIGKSSFDREKLVDNILTFMAMVVKLKPPAAKGQYIKKISISSTMGPGIKIDATDLQAKMK